MKILYLSMAILLLILSAAFFLREKHYSLKECQIYLESSKLNSKLIDICMNVSKKESDRGNHLGARVNGLYYILAKFDDKRAEGQFRRAVSLGGNDSRIDLVSIYYNRKPAGYCSLASVALDGYVIHNNDEKSSRDNWIKSLKRSGCDMKLR